MAFVVAILSEQRAQRGVRAAALFLLFGGGVFAVGYLAGKCFGASARAIETAGVPRTDLDHAAVDAAAAGRAVHEPERPQAGGQDSHAEAPDDGVPQERLSLPGWHLRPCDPGLGQLFRHWVSPACDSTSTARAVTIIVWRVMAEYGAICSQIKEKVADLPYFARRDTTRYGAGNSRGPKSANKRHRLGYSVTSSVRPGTRHSPNGRYGRFAGIAGSIRFNAGKLHHLAPLFRLFHDELTEVAW